MIEASEKLVLATIESCNVAIRSADTKATSL